MYVVNIIHKLFFLPSNFPINFSINFIAKKVSNLIESYIHSLTNHYNGISVQFIII